MATGKRVWTSQTWIEGDGTPTYTTLSGTTEESSTTVDLATNGYDVIVLWPEVDFAATPTDNVYFKIYSSADGGTTWDNLPFYQITIYNTTDPSRLAVELVNPPPTIKTVFQQTGSIDTHQVRCSYKAASWSIA